MPSASPPIDLDAIAAAPVTREPFPWFMVPGFVKTEALEAINADFPAVAHAGSFPLPTLQYGPAFQRFMDAIQGPAFRAAVAEKLGLDLSQRPTMVTVRGISAERDGQIHTDSVTKLVTVLIYMNGKWEAPGRAPAAAALAGQPQRRDRRSAAGRRHAAGVREQAERLARLRGLCRAAPG